MAIANYELVVGQDLKIPIKTEEGQSVYKKYKVIGLYPYHVLLKDEKTGVRQSITNAELFCMGILSNQYKVATPNPLCG